MKDRREGKSPGTQASEFVREEIHHIREGKHGARSTKQAIAIGLSKARRAGVRLPAPASGEAPEATRQGANRDLAAGRHPGGKISRKRSSATCAALERESHGAGSKAALATQARSAARKRGPAARSAAARMAVRTKGAAGLTAAARKAARTRSTRNG